MVIDFHYFNGGGGSGSGVTPAQVQAQIDSALTVYTPTSGFSTINGSAITDGSAIVIAEPDLSGYWTSAQTEEAISAATSGKADASSVTANTGRTLFPTWNSQGIITGVKTEASDKTVKVNGSTFHFYSSEGFDLPSIYSPANAGNAGDILVSTGGVPVWSAVTIPDLSAYTPTSGFSTINGSAITDGSALIIDAGAGSESVIELTQAQYDALSAYAPDTTYIITDAQSINMDDYALTADTEAIAADVATISGDVATKATKVNVTANTSNYYFPAWNTEGIITGNSGNRAYTQSLNINGTSKTMVQTTNSSFGTIYAPTTAGSAGQPVLSNGSGAPVWGAKAFAFISQTDYDNLPTKDANTIYFITGD